MVLILQYPSNLNKRTYKEHFTELVFCYYWRGCFIEKIAVIDIETTDTKIETGLIVEIGIVTIEIDTGKIEIVFDRVIRELDFSEKHRSSWIFQNSSLKFEDVQQAQSLAEIFSECQNIINKYRMTAYPVKFDLSFMEQRGFHFENRLPCIMETATNILKLRGSHRGPYKYPSLEETWNHYFPMKKFTEKHRAAADAKSEAEIVYKMILNGDYYEVAFSATLNTIYNEITKESFDPKKIQSGFDHEPKNNDQALFYVNRNLPLHYAKVRQVLRIKNLVPQGCGNIHIIDLACGPGTFILSFLDELLDQSKEYGGAAYNIRIFGIDKSEYFVKIANRMLDSWIHSSSSNHWNIEKRIICDNANFDDLSVQIDGWLNPEKHWVYLSCIAGVTSGITNLVSVIQTLQRYKNSIRFVGLIINPENYQTPVNADDIKKEIKYFTIEEFNSSVLCKKPPNMHFNRKIIYSSFQSILIGNSNIALNELATYSDFLNSQDELILFLNKARKWLLGEKLVDHFEILLYELNLPLTHLLLKNSLSHLIRDKYPIYQIQKGVFLEKEREMALIDMPTTILNVIILCAIGSDLDANLGENILCSRMCEEVRLDKIFEFFTEGWQKFSNFELEYSSNEYKLCQADIKKYYGTINHSKLKKRLSKILLDQSLNSDLIKVIFDIIGHPKGLPIGLPFSPLLANLFLKDFDIGVTNKSFTIAYTRYMDDFKIIIKKEFNDTELVKKSLKALLKKLDLDLAEDDKFSIKDIDKNAELYLFNQEFKDFTDEYFEILDPIKSSIIEFCSKIENREDWIKNNSEFISKLSRILEQNNITFDAPSLFRFLFIVNQKLKDPSFFIQLSLSDLKIPEEIGIWDVEVAGKKFYILNKIWVDRKFKFSKKMYERLDKELQKWDDLSRKIENSLNSEKKDNTEIIKQRDDTLKKSEFQLSMRMIKYLVYRLTRIKYYRLNDINDKNVKRILRSRLIGFPIKLLGLFLFRYRHFEALESLLDDTRIVIETDGNTSHRAMYQNDYAFLVTQLSQIYKSQPHLLLQKITSWIKTGIKIFTEKTDPEKLAMTEFFLQLNLIDNIPINDWITWACNTNNLYLLKNFMLCIAKHSDSEEFIPDTLKNKIVQCYRQNETTTALVMWIWTQFKKSKNENPFSRKDIFTYVKKFPKDINLDFEFYSLFDWEEGFGGNNMPVDY